MYMTYHPKFYFFAYLWALLKHKRTCQCDCNILWNWNTPRYMAIRYLVKCEVWFFIYFFFGLLILDYHFHALVSCKNKFGKIINNFRIDLAALGMNPCWWCFLRHAHMNLKRFSWILIKGYSKTAFVAEDETGQRVSHLENEKKLLGGTTN